MQSGDEIITKNGIVNVNFQTKIKLFLRAKTVVKVSYMIQNGPKIKRKNLFSSLFSTKKNTQVRWTSSWIFSWSCWNGWSFRSTTKDFLRWPAPLTKSELWFVQRPWRKNIIPNLASSQERTANTRSGGHLMPFPTMHMKGQKESKLLNSRALWTGIIMGISPDNFGAKGRQRKKEKAGHCFSLLWVPLLQPDTAGQWVSNFVHQNRPN